jgi:hypothetical protein
MNPAHPTTHHQAYLRGAIHAVGLLSNESAWGQKRKMTGFVAVATEQSGVPTAHISPHNLLPSALSAACHPRQM